MEPHAKGDEPDYDPIEHPPYLDLLLPDVGDHVHGTIAPFDGPKTVRYPIGQGSHVKQRNPYS